MNNRLDTIFSEAVLTPWESQCSSSENPWTANSELKEEWLQMSRSSDPEISLCGALALSRTSDLAPSIADEMEQFFNNPDRLSGCTPSLVASILLSGASPPHLFLQSYIALGLSSSPSRGLWSLFSSYIRHPHTASFESSRLFRSPPPPRIAFLLNANPLRDFSASGSGIWDRALDHFRAPRKYVPPTEPEVVLLAHSLRVDWGSAELGSWIKSACFSREIKRGLICHPALATPCPTVNHANPSIHAIAFFSGNDPVSKVWRFYNPLLIMPWLMDPGVHPETETEMLGTLTLGALPALAGPLATKAPFVDAHPMSAISP